MMAACNYMIQRCRAFCSPPRGCADLGYWCTKNRCTGVYVSFFCSHILPWQPLSKPYNFDAKCDQFLKDLGKVDQTKMNEASSLRISYENAFEAIKIASDMESKPQFLGTLVQLLKEEGEKDWIINLLASCFWVCLTDTASHRLQSFLDEISFVTRNVVTHHNATYHFTGDFGDEATSRIFLYVLCNCYARFYSLAIDLQGPNDVVPLILGNLFGPLRQIMAMILLGGGALMFSASLPTVLESDTASLTDIAVFVLMSTHSRALSETYLAPPTSPASIIHPRSCTPLESLRESIKVLLEVLDHGTNVDYISCTVGADAIFVSLRELNSRAKMEVLLVFNQLLVKMSMTTFSSRLLIIVTFLILGYNSQLDDVPSLIRNLHLLERLPPLPKTGLFVQSLKIVQGIDISLFDASYNLQKLLHVLYYLLSLQRWSIEHVLKEHVSIARRSMVDTSEGSNYVTKLLAPVARLVMSSLLMVIFVSQNDQQQGFYKPAVTNLAELIAANDTLWTILLSLLKDSISENPFHSKIFAQLMLDLVQANTGTDFIPRLLQTSVDDIIVFANSTSKLVDFDITTLEYVYGPSPTSKGVSKPS